MKKLLFFIPLFLAASAFPDFRPCLEKYSYIKNSIPVTKTKSVTFSKKNCKNYDPFTGMCVIEGKNKKYVKFFNNPLLGWWAGSVKKDEIYVGNYARDEVFFKPALLSVKSVKNSVIADMFCRAIGIGRGDGFIRGDMVSHFVNYGYWGDVGIEADEDMKITMFDPFYTSGLKTGYKIEKINSKPANVKTFTRYVLMGSEGKKVQMVIEGKKYSFVIRKKIYKYTPLEHYGIFVDDKLKVLKMPEKLKRRYYFGKNTKIVEINGRPVKNLRQLNTALSTYGNVTITFENMGIKLKVPLR